MTKELTISLEEKTYDSLVKLVGKENTSQFIEQILFPHLSDELEEFTVTIPNSQNRKIYLRSPKLKNSPRKLKMQVIEETTNA